MRTMLGKRPTLASTLMILRSSGSELFDISNLLYAQTLGITVVVLSVVVSEDPDQELRSLHPLNKGLDEDTQII